MPVQLAQCLIVSAVDALNTTAQVAMELMHSWMCLPPQSTSDLEVPTPGSFKALFHQSCVLHLSLSTTLNCDVLFLPAVQDAWLHLPAVVFGKCGINGLPDETWNALQKEIIKMGIGDQDSEAEALICAHATVCTKHPKPQSLAIPVLSPEDLDILSANSMLDSATVALLPYWSQYQSTEAEPALSTQSQPSQATATSNVDTQLTPGNSKTESAAAHLKSLLCDFIPLSVGNTSSASLSPCQTR